MVDDPLQRQRAISSIKIGERHRRDLGDVDGLAASIKDIGLLHPVVVTPNGKLIAGHRRLQACRQLGWWDIPVTEIDISRIVHGEFAENTFRKDFTLSEAVAIKRELEPIERAAAKERQGIRTDKLVGEFPTGKQRALDRIAKVVGKDRTTIARAEAIVDAAEAEPERFNHLLEQMDKTNRVNGVYRRLKLTRQAEAIRAEPPPLPGRGPYRVATCDVPWPSEPDASDPSCRGYWPFPTMSIEQICALDVGSIMHEDAILWFWTTNFHMRFAFKVLDAWGFHQTPTILTWAKDRANPAWGFRLRGQTEHCIMAIRGEPVVQLTTESTLLLAPVRKPLGTKPVEFYRMVETLCPAPRYADIFSRYRHSDKWDCHGDQAPPAMEAAQ